MPCGGRSRTGQHQQNEVRERGRDKEEYVSLRLKSIAAIEARAQSGPILNLKPYSLHSTNFYSCSKGAAHAPPLFGSWENHLHSRGDSILQIDGYHIRGDRLALLERLRQRSLRASGPSGGRRGCREKVVINNKGGAGGTVTFALEPGMKRVDRRGFIWASALPEYILLIAVILAHVPAWTRPPLSMVSA